MPNDTNDLKSFFGLKDGKKTDKKELNLSLFRKETYLP